MPTTDPAAPERLPLSPLRLLARLRGEWRRRVVAALDHDALLEVARGESLVTGRFLFMMTVSAAIAILGLLQSSPAVVIGAMLLSPLMGPIIGAGFALAAGDSGWLRRAVRTVLVGSVLGILVAAAIVTLSPLTAVTAEIAARTKPTLFDLGIAVFSGMAGAYAEMHRRAAALVGVAIATALVPPLAVIGFGLATFNRAIAGGAGLLLLTNLVAISLTAALVARLHGVVAPAWSRFGRWQALGVAATFALLAVPLSLSLRQLVWDVEAPRTASARIAALFGPDARVSALTISPGTDRTVRLSATVLTPRILDDGEERLRAALEQAYERPVDLALDQLRVDAGLGAEEAELAAAHDREAREREAREARDVAIRIALATRMQPGDVMVDRRAHRARLAVPHREAMGLADWKGIEDDLRALTPGWDIALVPPREALLLPGDAGDDKAYADALDTIAWAARRTGLPLRLEGSPAATAALRKALQARKIPVIDGDGRGPARLGWSAAMTG